MVDEIDFDLVRHAASVGLYSGEPFAGLDEKETALIENMAIVASSAVQEYHIQMQLLKKSE